MAKLKNKNLLYKLGIPILGATAVVAPLATLVSCGVNDTIDYGNTWKFDSHRTVQMVYQGRNEYEALGVTKFAAPLALTQGNAVAIGQNATFLSFFRIVKDQKDTPVFGPDGLKNVDTHRDVKYRFSITKSMTITHKDGSKTEITNDALTEKEAGSHDAWTHSINYKVGDELNAVKSIEDKGLTKVELEFDNNVFNKHWIHQLTGKPAANISADDVFTGFMQAMSGNTKTARNLSGLTDAEYTLLYGVVNKLAPSANIKEPRSSSTDHRLYMAGSALGLDVSPYKQFDKTKVIKNSGTSTTYEFNFINQSIDNLILSSFITDYLLDNPIGLTSTAEIEQAKNNKSLENAIKAVPELNAKWSVLENSTLWKSGAFQRFLLNKEDYTVAGQYFVSGSEVKLLTFEQNPEFADERWLNQKNKNNQLTTIKTLKLKYVDVDVQSNINIMNEYKIGTSATASFASLDARGQIAALENPSAWGVSFSKGYNSNNFTNYGDYSGLQLLPLSPSTSPKNWKVYFNNNYSRVMWGKTISELKADMTSTDGAWVKSVFAGTGMAFRQNIDALVNAYTIVNNANAGSPKLQQDWTNTFAPDAIVHDGITINDAIRLFDSIKSHEKNPSTLSPEDQKIYNSMNEILKVTSKWGLSINGDTFNWTEITRDDFIQSYRLASANPYGPTQANVDILKANMKKVLDDANIPMDQKVTWEFSFGRGVISPIYNAEYRNLFQFINSIDPRLNVVAQLEGVNEKSNEEPRVLVQYPDPAWTTGGNTVHPEKLWLERLYGNGAGYNSGSLALIGSYSSNTPAAPILENMGYLQAGTIFGLSYYADEGVKYTIQAGSPIAGISHVIDALKRAWDITKASYFKDESVFHSIKAKDFFNSISNFDWTKLWHSNMNSVATYDYLGFFGLQTIASEEERISTQTTPQAGDDLIKADASYVQNTMNTWFAVAKIELQKILQTLSTNEVASVMSAFDIIYSSDWNPINGRQNSTERPSAALSKNWLTNSGTDLSEGVSISRYYVDLDVDANNNPILDGVY